VSDLLVWLVSRGGQIVIVVGMTSVLVYAVRAVIREGL
jgi:hypothetical protein